GHHHFKDVTAEVGLRPHGWCGDASFGDVNGTGWPSIYFLNMKGSNSYFENDGRMDLLITDMHSDMSQEPGTDNEKQKSTITWNDSYLQGKKSDFIFGNALYHNLGGGKFEEVSDKMGVENYWPWGVSVGDVNADGWDDIFISSGMSFPYRYGINSLLLNDRGQKFRDSEFILGI